MCVCVCACACKQLPSNQGFDKQISSHQKGGGVSRWSEWVGKATAYKFDTCTLIGVHLTMHLVDPINPFPALIKSKYLLNFDYFCSIFISRRWSAVSLNHSIPPEPMMNQLRDGGGFVA